ncbi:TPA: hypothetical protein ACH3X1_002016 [Trebouxia sp. C0004]
MAEATPTTAVPNARLSGSKRKKVPGSSGHTWDSYLHKVLQDSHPGNSARAYFTSSDSTNVRASLELLLTKGE